MRKRLESRSGQTIVEFAFMLPLILIIILGIIEFSLIFYDKAMITNASREGARAGSLYRVDGTGAYSPLTDTEIQTVVNNYLASRLLTFGTPTTATTTVSPGTRVSGGTVDVRVTWNYTFLAFSRFAGWGAQIPMAAESIMRME